MEKDTVTQSVSLRRVRESFALSLGLEPEEIASTSKLIELADSLEMAQLILDLEEDFHTEITDDDLKHMFTVQDVLNYLNGSRSN